MSANNLTRSAYERVNLADAYAVWRRHLQVYLRLWKMELAAPLIEPIFMIFAFGWGIGSLIAHEVKGVSYLSYAGAGVLAFAVISRAMFETAYGSYFRMIYQATFDAILASPVEPESLAFAELCWATTKSLIDAAFILSILFVFGAANSTLALLTLFPLLAGSFLNAAVTLYFTAHVHVIDSYNFYNAIFFSLILVCGVWFPVDVLPRQLQALTWLIPLTSAADLTRSLLVGQLLSRHLWEALYLVYTAFAAAELAMRALRRRMVV